MKSKRFIITLICIVSVMIVVLLGFLYVQVSLSPVAEESTSIEFEVVEGDTIHTVIDRLEEEKLIKNATVSKLYAKLKGLHNIKAGYFLLDPSWNTRDILEHVNNPDHSGESASKITFKEGLWAKDIAAILQERLSLNYDELMALWNDESYLQTLIDKYEFLTPDILNSEYRVKLEGYLFPETYAFPKNSDAKQVTEIFLDHFNTVYEKYKADIQNSGMSIQEIITFASMIQFEASTKEDMYQVAGVFKNRLQQNMTLGSSVTVCYALYDQFESPDDCETNPDIDSPYNTYRNSGLPIGPILNPGEIAIDAALHPEESEYLYFLADIYGDGKVYYSKTQAEHDALMDRFNLRK